MPLGLYSMGPFRTQCSAAPRAPPVSPAYHVNGFSAVTNSFIPVPVLLLIIIIGLAAQLVGS